VTNVLKSLKLKVVLVCTRVLLLFLDDNQESAKTSTSIVFWLSLTISLIALLTLQVITQSDVMLIFLTCIPDYIKFLVYSFYFSDVLADSWLSSKNNNKRKLRRKNSSRRKIKSCCYECGTGFENEQLLKVHSATCSVINI
jgi:hypothetical protein